MNEYEQALERDLGIRIRPSSKQSSADERLCYGASCTWFGPIQEVSNTFKHPRWQAHRAPTENASLPCCPLCGSMLFEMENAAPWWEGVDVFEKGMYPAKKPHPGYRKLWEWQRDNGLCFPDLETLLSHYKQATGITVDIEP